MRVINLIILSISVILYSNSLSLSVLSLGTITVSFYSDSNCTSTANSYTYTNVPNYIPQGNTVGGYSLSCNNNINNIPNSVGVSGLSTWCLKKDGGNPYLSGIWYDEMVLITERSDCSTNNNPRHTAFDTHCILYCNINTV